ncbi:hypothetical protein [Mycoplasma ovis]|nr:hypothetical protein [Mycoplasma ovis]
MMLSVKYFLPMIVAGGGGLMVASNLRNDSFKPEINLSNLEVVNGESGQTLSSSGWWLVKRKG